ncbi:hypothetical protein [Sphingomonas turrisvirgatae]|uniref:Uncharacterized protein n=1 Tax=Sphingomonas turrisvirgatae TaxID=1888892 RepID=A0A1E3LR02_9SPHN|nr:hypothetical protein [Sphingomonas turrisvirgatae]ODP36196.1 hypothetical protein BFL28_07245 [Sphingomonas turrisvirgatae]
MILLALALSAQSPATGVWFDCLLDASGRLQGNEATAEAVADAALLLCEQEAKVAEYQVRHWAFMAKQPMAKTWDDTRVAVRAELVAGINKRRGQVR